nr:GxxExxY protein [uncultured bacterium]
MKRQGGYMDLYEPSQIDNDLTSAIIGAAIEVHRSLGPGFLESIYENAMDVELRLREIPFVRQHCVPVSYKSRTVGDHRLDYLVVDRMVVELKAVDAIAPIHKAQIMSYLRATQLHLGLIVNFNVTVLKNGICRVVVS